MRTGDQTAWALARLSVVAFACVMLANCSSQSRVGKLDPKLGVAASPRVIEPGQPVPKGGGVYRVGKPYVVAGRTYYPEENLRYRADGLGSWYGDDFHGRLTANREVYDMDAISAAHPTLPMPSYARVTNLANGRSLVVRVNDRGPYHQGREIDLSARAADLLGYKARGTTRVRVEYIGPAPLEGTDDRQLVATLRDGEPAPAPSGVRVASRSLLGGLFGPTPAMRGGAPMPQERPYALGQDDLGADLPLLRSRTFEARGPVLSEVSARAEASAEPRLTSPVSAFAPMRYDGTQAVATGRGLY
jgi:peptidoglycan lytic transglycosylase